MPTHRSKMQLNRSHARTNWLAERDRIPKIQDWRSDGYKCSDEENRKTLEEWLASRNRDPKGYLK